MSCVVYTNLYYVIPLFYIRMQSTSILNTEGAFIHTPSFGQNFRKSWICSMV